MTYSILDSILDAFGIFLFALAFFHFIRLAVVAAAQVIRERKSRWAIKRLRLPLTCLAVLLCLTGCLATGCVTSKSADGTTTKRLDPEAVAVINSAVIEALNHPAVSNAIFNATAPKAAKN